MRVRLSFFILVSLLFFTSSFSINYEELNSFNYTLDSEGWVDLHQFLKPSTGNFSLGEFGGSNGTFNDLRDPGSRILFFDTDLGNNSNAEVYWWNGTHIVDSNGSHINLNNGQIYGRDPQFPNEEAIRPFKNFEDFQDDIRISTQRGRFDDVYNREWRISRLSGGYQDWFLFKRGQVHYPPRLAGGKSESEPMVVSAYGSLEDGRAIINSSISGHIWGYNKTWLHLVLTSIEFHRSQSWLHSHVATSLSSEGGPVTMYMEDVYFAPESGIRANHVNYPPTKTKFRRSIFSHAWNDGRSHNQGYFTSGFENRVTFEDVIMYKNGFKEDPRHHISPRRDIYSRNIYQGGGAQMGHTYRNIISMDGGSGGPQMRLGGLMENSLIVEGYIHSGTRSSSPVNSWLEERGQVGTSAIVKNNVHFIFGSPTPEDPDVEGKTDSRSQPRWGYILQGASFGSLVKGNIISGVMLEDHLGSEARFGIQVRFHREQYANNETFNQRNNLIRDNVLYRVNDGFTLSGSGRDLYNILFTNNTVISKRPVRYSSLFDFENVSTQNLLFTNNTFYSSNPLPQEVWFDNETNVRYENFSNSSNLTDPNRTIKQYLTEHLGLELLNWDDARIMGFNESQIQAREALGLEFDPAGLRTFGHIATNMRKGGVDPIPTSGKPPLEADFRWDERFTSIGVVNWVREGFNLPPVYNLSTMWVPEFSDQQQEEENLSQDENNETSAPESEEVSSNQERSSVESSSSQSDSTSTLPSTQREETIESDEVGQNEEISNSTIQNETPTRDLNNFLENSCIPHFSKSSWRLCKEGFQNRTIEDLRGCYDLEIETRQCVGKSEIENLYLNARFVNLSHDDFDENLNLFNLNLRIDNYSARVPEVIILSAPLLNGNYNTAIIYERVGDTFYMANLMDTIDSSYYYRLTRITEQSIPELFEDGLISDEIYGIFFPPEPPQNVFLEFERYIPVLIILSISLVFIFTITIYRLVHRHNLNKSYFEDYIINNPPSKKRRV